MPTVRGRKHRRSGKRGWSGDGPRTRSEGTGTPRRGWYPVPSLFVFYGRIARARHATLKWYRRTTSEILVRMSESVSFADYRAALTLRGARAAVVTSLLARLPVAMMSMVLMLYVQQKTGTFAAAGLVSAAALTGVAVGSVAQGRVMDRIGPSIPLYVMSAIFSLLAVVTIFAVEFHAPLGPLGLLALAFGVSQPNVLPASRALWGHLLSPGRARDAAYAYEAISMEIFFVLGPGLGGILVAAPWPGTGLVVGTSCMALGSIGFASTRAARGARPALRADQRTPLLGPLVSPGMRTVALAAFGFGLLLGGLDVAVPAAAVYAGTPALGGVLLSVMSISSVVTGLLYGIRPWPRSMHLRMPVLLLGFAVFIALLGIPSSLIGLCAALLLAGCWIAPQATAHSVALDFAAPEGTATESFGWVITAVTLGAAGGQWLSGQVVDVSGSPAAFVIVGALGVVLAGAVFLRRHTLVRPSPRQALVLN